MNGGVRYLHFSIFQQQEIHLCATYCHRQTHYWWSSQQSPHISALAMQWDTTNYGMLTISKQGTVLLNLLCRAVSKYMQVILTKELSLHHHCILKLFFCNDPQRFLDTLAKFDTVIASAVALVYFEGCSTSHPNICDICIPFQHYQDFEKWAREIEGYRPDNRVNVVVSAANGIGGSDGMCIIPELSNSIYQLSFFFNEKMFIDGQYYLFIHIYGFVEIHNWELLFILRRSIDHVHLALSF